jgi:phosphomethylpyrimidine synthase
MERVAKRESRDPEFVREQVADGQAVIPNNHAHDSLDPMIVGREFATKVTSTRFARQTSTTTKARF